MKYVRVSVLLAVLVSVLITGCTPPTATPPPPTDTKAPPTAVPPTPTEEAKGQWEVILQTKVEQQVRMAAFLGEDFGVTGGAASEGKAHYTTDGGETWTLAESSGG